MQVVEATRLLVHSTVSQVLTGGAQMVGMRSNSSSGRLHTHTHGLSSGNQQPCNSSSASAVLWCISCVVVQQL